ncbi:MAG TPA: PilZ domain-containing protein [Blastocatellia bacterium]|nr:PilZ domain-containing protein [Blastocatellia bacterium]
MERRKWPRYRLDCTIQLHEIGPSGSKFVSSGRLRNISVGGVLSNIGQGVPIGTKVEVAVGLQLMNPVEMKFAGEVVRVEPAADGVEIAVRFYSSRPTFSPTSTLM